MDDAAIVRERAFLEEFVSIMEKEAAVPTGILSRLGKAVAGTPEIAAHSSRIGGSLLGAGAGAGLEAYRAPEGQRAERALMGGILGAGLGLGVGQLAAREGRKQVGRFGQRQLHSMTGYVPGQGLLGRGISKLPEAERQAARMTGARKMRLTGSGWRMEEAKRLRAAGGDQNLKRAKKLEQAVTPGSLEEARRKATWDVGMEQGLSNKLLSRLTKNNPEMRQRLINLKAGLSYAPREGVEAGATSIPGVVRGLALGPASGQGRGAVLRGATLGSGGLGLGLAGMTGLSSAPDAIKGTGQYKDIKTTGGRVGRWAGDTAGWALGGSVPLVGSIGLGSMGGRVGEVLGRGAERAGQGTVGFVQRGLGQRGVV